MLIPLPFERRLRQWQERQRYRRRYCAALGTLNAMSNRDLADIGMNRGDFPSIAAEMARK